MATNQTNNPQHNENKQAKTPDNPGQFGQQDDQTRRTTGQGEQSESQNDQTRQATGQRDQSGSQMHGGKLDENKQDGQTQRDRKGDC